MVFRQPFEDMKRPLGRGLENLMPSELPGEASAPEGDSVQRAPAGVERLIRGRDQLELGESVSSRSSASRSITPRESEPARVPSWVFYLGDLVLMSAVVWMIVLNADPMSRREGLVCLGLVLMAASIGLWPWLRNVLYCNAFGESRNLPKWAIAEKVVVGGVSKCLVIHLGKPQVAVEIIETSWKGTNAKPYWIDGPPNFPPGGVKSLIEEAESFYRTHLVAEKGEVPASSAPLTH
jgi:hypothetical protein